MKNLILSFVLTAGTLSGQDLVDHLKTQATAKGWRVNENIEKKFTTIIHAEAEVVTDQFFVFYGPVKESGRHLTETRELEFEGKIGHQEMYLRNIHPIYGTDLRYRKFRYEGKEYASLFSRDGDDGIGASLTLMLSEDGIFYFLEFYFYHEDPEIAYRMVREVIEP